MTGRLPLRPSRPPLGRVRGLLLLALFAGLFGMHALGPGGAVVDRAQHSPHSVAAVALHSDAGDEYVCHGSGGLGGHAHHADPTCASGALGAGPVLPLPAADAVGAVTSVDGPRGSFAVAPEGGRAPPTLAELQLLRI
ncbi:DUF6153 family protein [Streptomyces sp. B93]|uniref:DUF6153 family protein n=1 Tax=Streptomyces sp. B93 TaxID=2824875 RepID=UPI0027E4619C|nr:DUF6153 family protein [Streptomyces sp. B93]